MKSRKKYLSDLLLVSMVAVSLVMTMNGCKKSEDNSPSTPSTPPANEVWMQNTAFTPSTITVSVNTTITWRNKDSMTHNVVADNGSFNSGNFGGGGTYSHEFTTAGTFHYTCTLHSGMAGQVIVQ